MHFRGLLQFIKGNSQEIEFLFHRLLFVSLRHSVWIVIIYVQHEPHREKLRVDYLKLRHENNELSFMTLFSSMVINITQTNWIICLWQHNKPHGRTPLLPVVLEGLGQVLDLHGRICSIFKVRLISCLLLGYAQV